MADDGGIRRGWRRLGRAELEASAEAAGDAAESRSEQASGTFIGSGALFEGTLSLRGDFHVDTEFRGELETDGRITVGPRGSVVGNLRAREVRIEGAVVGDVSAPRLLVVEAHGRLHGDIETACLEIRRYAFFQGRTSMTQPQERRAGDAVHAGTAACAPPA